MLIALTKKEKKELTNSLKSISLTKAFDGRIENIKIEPQTSNDLLIEFDNSTIDINVLYHILPILISKWSRLFHLAELQGFSYLNYKNRREFKAIVNFLTVLRQVLKKTCEG